MGIEEPLSLIIAFQLIQPYHITPHPYNVYLLLHHHVFDPSYRFICFSLLDPFCSRAPSQTLDDDVLKHKKDPEELQSKAMSIISACCKGSGDEIVSRCTELESRFDTFSQMSLEYQEQCDETKSAMQAFQTKFDSFSHWLEGVEGKLAEKKRSKFPISTVQSQLDEHYVSITCSCVGKGI